MISICIKSNTSCVTGGFCSGFEFLFLSLCVNKCIFCLVVLLSGSLIIVSFGNQDKRKVKKTFLLILWLQKLRIAFSKALETPLEQGIKTFITLCLYCCARTHNLLCFKPWNKYIRINHTETIKMMQLITDLLLRAKFN